ncbi:hypothetical protein CPT76_20275 [Paenibacillus sp. AR247]|nr:hypothetical protein CPT76_20275 [Paenibacillus sp. AR247]
MIKAASKLIIDLLFIDILHIFQWEGFGAVPKLVQIDQSSVYKQSHPMMDSNTARLRLLC